MNFALSNYTLVTIDDSAPTPAPKPRNSKESISVEGLGGIQAIALTRRSKDSEYLVSFYRANQETSFQDVWLKIDEMTEDADANYSDRLQLLAIAALYNMWRRTDHRFGRGSMGVTITVQPLSPSMAGMLTFDLVNGVRVVPQ